MKVAYIDNEGIVCAVGFLNNAFFPTENIIQVDDDFDLSNKRWNGTSWEDYIPPEPPTPEPTTEEKILAAVEKSQDEVRQEGADMIMEELMKRGVVK